LQNYKHDLIGRISFVTFKLKYIRINQNHLYCQLSLFFLVQVRTLSVVNVSNESK